MFRTAYPLTERAFEDGRFPGRVVLGAFNPFIPLQEDDSGIPAGFFEIAVENTRDAYLDYTIAFSLCLPFQQGKAEHGMTSVNGRHFLTMTRLEEAKDSLRYGEMCVATDEKDISFQQYW